MSTKLRGSSIRSGGAIRGGHGLRRLIATLAVAALVGSCTGNDPTSGGSQPPPLTTVTPTPITAPLPSDVSTSPVDAAAVLTKWDLWSSGSTLLRGANIWQSVVIPDLDGATFKGSGRVGPPYTQTDFDQLAALGANYVSISGPGLFTEQPPFQADHAVVAHLESLLAMIAEADMFATIGFRTGPGRSEYGLCCGGDNYFDGYFNDTVWEDAAAQGAWAEMWRYTADRFKDHPAVVGYKLMVEPNAGAVFFDVYEPDEFYPEFEGTLLDWNELYPDLVEAIREVDPDTPILVGGMGFSSLRWMPYLDTIDVDKIVYVAHQYEPFDDYTHQEPSDDNTYPGSFDLDYDDEDDDFDRAWLDRVLLAPLDAFRSQNQATVTVDEFGVNRWVPGADAYMADIMDLFEARAMNHALWEWQASWPEFRLEVHPMDFRFGPDPDNLIDTQNDLMDAITAAWARNRLRLSDAPWADR